MCGISGIVSPQASELEQALELMVNTQHHRGPDETGFYKSEQCLLGHNRLSIVDLGSGQQPMHSADGRYTIVFNGEIYGYKKLRATLDYPFKTHSDTEVILALYLAHGKDMLALLPGMFAFAIWDSVKEELFIARDRVGEKPFYYSTPSNNEFIFASEVGTLASSGLIDLELDMQSIGHFLSKLYVHPNHSIYKHIHALPPGYCGTFAKGVLTTEQYWRPGTALAPMSYLEAVEELESLFAQSISDQLIADVPVSVFLSGGLDSSTVAAYAAKTNANIEALCFRFRSGFDEGIFANDVAQMHGLPIKDLWESENDNIAELFVDSVKCYGEPFADSSSIPTLMICREAVKHAKVVLSGDGADELFGGYTSRYRPGVYMENLLGKHKIRWQAARAINGILNKARPSDAQFQQSQAAKYLLQGKNIPQAMDEANSIFKDTELAALGLSRHAPNWPSPQGDTNDAMRQDMQNYLPGDILVKTDRAAMAVGLEVRAPFLAKEIMDFACALPSSFKITTETDKRIMRDAFASQWPVSVKSRSKQGFGSPVAAWLNNKDMQALHAEAFLPQSKIYSLLDKSFIDAHKADRGMRGWALLNLAVWLGVE